MGKIIRLNETTVRCPLCQDFMLRKYDSERSCFIYACETDRVACRTDDPFVGKWDAAHAAAGIIECPNCNASMRWFGTSTGYMKAVCVKKKCGATISAAEPDRDLGVEVATPEKMGEVQ